MAGRIFGILTSPGVSPQDKYVRPWAILWPMTRTSSPDVTRGRLEASISRSGEMLFQSDYKIDVPGMKIILNFRSSTVPVVVLCCKTETQVFELWIRWNYTAGECLLLWSDIRDDSSSSHPIKNNKYHKKYKPEFF